MLELGVFLLLVFGLWRIFRPIKTVVKGGNDPMEPQSLAKNSQYYIQQYPELLKGEKQPSARETPPLQPPNIIINITHNHLHEHLHVHVKEEDMEI